MANNNIVITQTATVFSADLAQTLRQLVSAKAKLQYLKDRMDNQTDGVTWTTIEAQFGLPAGKGQTTYNLVTGALTHFTGTSTLNEVSLRDLLAWVGVPA